MHPPQPTTQGGQARRDLAGEAASPHRDAIVREAKELIRDSGYGQLTVERVIQAAGVSRATFYFYFRNKKHLFLEVANAVMEEMFEVAGRHYPEKDEFSRIVLANVSYLGIWKRESRFLCEFFAISLTDDEFHAIYDWHRKRFESRISGRFDRLLEQQRIPACIPILLAASLSSMVEFMAVRYFGPQEDVIQTRYSFRQLIAALSESWYRSVYGRPAPSGFDYSQFLPREDDELQG